MDPRWLQNALGEEPVAPSPINFTEVAATANRIPMRSTNRSLNAVKGSRVSQRKDAFEMGMQLFNRMMGAGMEASSLPGFKLLQPDLERQVACREQGSIAAKSLPVANTAIPPTLVVAESPAPTVGEQPLVKHGMDIKNPSVPAKAANVSTVSAAEMLQKELEAAKAKTAPTSEYVTEAEQENIPPAQTTSKPPPTKKQASSVKKAKAKSKSKKSQSQGKKPAKDIPKKKLSDDEHYKWLLKSGIPLKALMLRKYGCGTCRQRAWCTRSCWTKRGFSL